jgi:hypothetical protein
METDESQKEQVDSMLSDFFPSSEQPVEEPVAEEPADETKGEESQADEGETTKEEVTDIEDKERKETPAEITPVAEEVQVADDEITTIKKQNEILMQRIEELSGKIMEPAKVAEPQVQESQTNPSVYDIIGDNDIDDVLASKELFNSAISKAMKMAEESAVQKIFTSLPHIVMKQMQQQFTIKQATDEFYRDNPDLEPVKKTVAAVANEIYSTNPQLSVVEIFQKSAEKTREILGLRKQATRLVNEQGRMPELVKRTQGNREKMKIPNVDKMQQELSDLLNF